MSENYNYCHIVGKTDVGRKRAVNEDNMFNTVTQNGLVSVVCDGMGGHVGGATASKIAVSTIIDNLNNVYYDDPRIAIGESIDKANKAIIQKTMEQPELAGMGSTCVLLLVRSGKVYIGHVGDSRIYLVRSKRIIQLTKDHSYVQMLVDHGEITKEQAEHHPRKNEITNALGIPNMSPATVAEDAIIPEAGDCFILCSDGLSGMVSDDKICKIISRQSEMNAQERIDKLVALANENGGVDNITVQLVEFSVSPNTLSDEKKFPSWAKIICAVLIVTALIVGGCLLWKGKTEFVNNNSPIAETKSEVEIKERYLGEIEYKKSGHIVEIVFYENSIELKRNNESSHIEEGASFDPTTLLVETQNIESKYNNSLLTFTDKDPGETIVFRITTSDKQYVYRFKYTIKRNDEPSIISTDLPQPKEPVNEGNQQVEDIKITQTIIEDMPPIIIEYDQLEEGTKLLLNYSAKPKLIFKQDEKSIGDSIIAKIIDIDEYDNVYWTKEHKDNSRQLSFTFKGKSSDATHKFVVLCELKKSEKQYRVIIDLVPQKDIAEDVLEMNTHKEVLNDTIRHELKYKKLEQGSEIQFNYVRIPYIDFDGAMIPIENEIDSIADISDNVNWDIEHKKDSRQIVFKFKGDSSESSQRIIIPFYPKESNCKSFIHVELLPINEKSNNDTISDAEKSGMDSTQFIQDVNMK